MKQVIVILAFLAAFASCKNGTDNGKVQTKRDSLLNNIQQLEKQISGTQALDMKLGASIVKAYLDFYKAFPKDANTADYLFKAGDVSMNLKQSQKAIEIFDNVYQMYPAYKKASFALFLEGFIYETQLDDISSAKEKYNKVVKEYPNSKIAEDAKASIANLGKSDAELIKEFEVKNKVK